MTLQADCKDKYGSYTLTYKTGVVCAVIKGMVSDYLSMTFTRDMLKIAETIPDANWGYYADHLGCLGYTPQSELNLINSHHNSRRLGCVVDAYRSGSALAIEQISQIRKRAGIQNDFRDRLFDNEEIAIEFINRTISELYPQAK